MEYNIYLKDQSIILPYGIKFVSNSVDVYTITIEKDDSWKDYVLTLLFKFEDEEPYKVLGEINLVKDTIIAQRKHLLQMFL